MPVLTKKQLDAIRKIISDASQALAVSIHGVETTDAELQHLADEGFIDPGNLADITLDSFVHGSLSNRLAEVRDMSWSEFQTYLKANPYEPGPIERLAVENLKSEAGIYCKGLGNTWDSKLGKVVVNADQELEQHMVEVIQDKTAAAEAQRRSVGTLRSDLKQETEDWGRDWDRIAHTELHMANNKGYVTDAKKLHDDPMMAMIPDPDACKDCLRLYLNNDGIPIVKPLSEWEEDGFTNVGRKKAEWKAVLGGAHPWCRCTPVRVPEGWTVDRDGVLMPSEDDNDEDWLISKSGPFIGPRGGKWADPEHKIPWKIDVTIHSRIGGSERKETFKVVDQKEGQVKISRHKEGNYGPWIPKESVKHFVNDLAGKVDLPTHGRKEIDSVVSGKAEFIGKGDDGLAFKVGDKVVKVSTTVPYQPENPGHRTPDKAAEMLKDQVEIGNKLANLGIVGIQKSEYIKHGDKGFQIKPWVKIPKKFTREQLDKIQDIVLEVHKHDYAIKDDIQAGLDKNNNPVLFDVGKAAKQSKATGFYSDITVDLENVARLYRDNGEKFVRRGVSEGQQAFDELNEEWDKIIDPYGKKPNLRLARMKLENVLKKLRYEAEVLYSGARLKKELENIETETDFMTWELEAKEVDEKKDLAKARKLQGRIEFQGLQISIENRKGSLRHWYDPHNKEKGTTKMLHPYGYIRLSVAADGEHVDCYIGPNKESRYAYVVHQMKAPEFKKYDEDKVMLGFDSESGARKAYLSHYNNDKFLGSITKLDMADFKKKVLRTIDKKDKMIKSVGPFIGPRGGKWADADHTIPWKEPSSKRTGKINVPYSVVSKTVDKLLEGQKFNRMGILVGDLKTKIGNIAIKTAKGKHIDVQVFMRGDSTVKDSRGVNGKHFLGAYGTGRIDHRVELYVSTKQHEKDTLSESLRSVLSHELTHAADPSLSEAARRNRLSGKKTKVHSRTGKTKDDYSKYINSKSEITARMQQIFRELNTPQVAKEVKEFHKLWSDEEDPSKDAVKSWTIKHIMPYSETWKNIEEYLTDNNRKRVLKLAARVVVQHVKKQSKPFEKSYMLFVAQGELLKKANTSPVYDIHTKDTANTGGFRVDPTKRVRSTKYAFDNGIMQALKQLDISDEDRIPRITLDPRKLDPSLFEAFSGTKAPPTELTEEYRKDAREGMQVKRNRELKFQDYDKRLKEQEIGRETMWADLK